MVIIQENHEQKIAYARASLWAPFYTVGMVARIQGDVPAGLAAAALRKLQVLYPPLASRVYLKEDGSAWLTTQGVGEFPLEVRPKGSDEDWVGIFLEQERVPFDFEQGPLTRFFLLRSGNSSDLISVAPHVVCDGYSMTHVMADAVRLLNDPELEVKPPPASPNVSWETVPHAASDSLFLRGMVRVLNRVWPDSRTVLSQDQYQRMYHSYWARQENGLLAFSLSPEETASLIQRCRQHGVTVTGALVAAFLLAQTDFPQNGHKNQRQQISIAMNIRDRMNLPTHGHVGVYASSIDLSVRSKPDEPFWSQAREAYQCMQKGLNNRSHFLRTLVLGELDPAIADGFIAAASTDQWSPAFKFMSHFIKVKGDVRSLDVSNIGRIDLPEVGEPFRLLNLLPFPPLIPGSRLALNVLTVGGQMNISLKYRSDRMDYATISKIKDLALGYLANPEQTYKVAFPSPLGGRNADPRSSKA